MARYEAVLKDTIRAIKFAIGHPKINGPLHSVESPALGSYRNHEAQWNKLDRAWLNYRKAAENSRDPQYNLSGAAGSLTPSTKTQKLYNEARSLADTIDSLAKIHHGSTISGASGAGM
jgi:hypothetical protein